MKVKLTLSVDKELTDKAKRLGLNISDYLESSLGTFLMGVPDVVIKQYATLDKTQRGKVNRKLRRISKELFSGVK